MLSARAIFGLFFAVSVCLKVLWFVFLRIDFFEDTLRYEHLALNILNGTYGSFASSPAELTIGMGETWTRAPLYPALIALTRLFTADRLVSVHFFPLILSALVSPLVFLYTMRVTGNICTGVLAGAIAMVMPPTLFWGSQALAGPVAMFFVTLALYMIDVGRSRAINWLLIGIVTSLAFLSHVDSVIFLLPIVFLGIYRSRGRYRWLFPLIGAAAFLAPVLFSTALILEHVQQETLSSFLGLLSFERFHKNFALVGLIIAKYMALNPVLFFSLAVGLYFAARDRRIFLSGIGLYLILQTLLISSYSFSLYPGPHPDRLFWACRGERYFILSTLPISFYAATGYDRLRKVRLARWRKSNYVDAILLASTVPTFALFNFLYITTQLFC